MASENSKMPPSKCTTGHYTLIIRHCKEQTHNELCAELKAQVLAPCSHVHRLVRSGPLIQLGAADAHQLQCTGTNNTTAVTSYACSLNMTWLCMMFVQLPGGSAAFGNCCWGSQPTGYVAASKYLKVVPFLDTFCWDYGPARCGRCPSTAVHRH